MTPKEKPSDAPLEAEENAPAPEENRTPAEAGEEAAQDEIARLKEELSAMRDQWLRAVAETENIRKRARREQEETSRYAVTAFARDMVSVLENLMRASASIPPAARGENELLKTLGEGVDLTQQELLGIFEKYGIKRLDPMGQKFDHHFHQAVAQVERNDVAPGTVVQVVQAGYVIHDRLLRPAMVAVSKAAEQPPNIEPVDTIA